MLEKTKKVMLVSSHLGVLSTARCASSQLKSLHWGLYSLPAEGLHRAALEGKAV